MSLTVREKEGSGVSETRDASKTRDEAWDEQSAKTGT